MHRYAALLRGIAPSGPNMTNDKLRGVFEGLGFASVTSVLASGNILFRSPADAPALEADIERALTRALGLSSRVIVRSQAELGTLVDSDPFSGLAHGRGTYLTATFVKDAGAPPGPVPAGLDRVTRVVGFDEGARAVLAVTDNTVPGRTPDFMLWLEKRYGKGITTRAWPTVVRILAKLEGMDAGS